MFDRDAYAAMARRRLALLGYEPDSVHEAADPQQAVAAAELIFIGGGNTFRLLKSLYDNDLLQPIRCRVAAGMPYLGSSAGSIVAGPTLKTTKDMPIVEPPSFDALGLVRFQISPHYLDPDPHTTHMGETQEERINQFLEENDAPVAGLREGTMLRIEGDAITLKGITSARIFRRGFSPLEIEPGANLSELLSHCQTGGTQ
jgi:dipeptidase E